MMERAKRDRPYSFRAWKQTVGGLEKAFLTKVLEKHNGNVTRAANALGVHRSTLQRLMRRHDLPAA
jgi:transcriptional regulator of acetoin/glycerol metabolism